MHWAAQRNAGCPSFMVAQIFSMSGLSPDEISVQAFPWFLRHSSHSHVLQLHEYSFLVLYASIIFFFF